MSDADANSRAQSPDRQSRWRPHVRLRTLLLATAAVAAWTTWWSAKSSIEPRRAKIAAYRAIAPQLEVTDPKRFATIAIDRWNDDEREWRVYVPPDGTFRLCLATGESLDGETPPAPQRAMEIPSGEHQIVLTEAAQQIELSLDGKPAEPLRQSKARRESFQSSGARPYSETHPADKPVRLFFIRDLAPAPGEEAKPPNAGIMVWIDREPPTTDKR